MVSMVSSKPELRPPPTQDARSSTPVEKPQLLGKGHVKTAPLEPPKRRTVVSIIRDLQLVTRFHRHDVIMLHQRRLRHLDILSVCKRLRHAGELLMANPGG